MSIEMNEQSKGKKLKNFFYVTLLSFPSMLFLLACLPKDGWMSSRRDETQKFAAEFLELKYFRLAELDAHVHGLA